MKIRKENYKYIEYMNNNSIVIEMVKRDANDPDFRDQIKKAKPETKEFLNTIFKTFLALDLN